MNSSNVKAKQSTMPLIFLAIEIVILIGSLILAKDKLVWILEVAPILIGLPILLLTYKKFQFTNFIYVFIILHSIILSVGGIYTYAKVPLGFWMQDWFGFARNHYDRIGHFAQGFIPALITREVLIRKSPLKSGKWLSFIVISICLSISALYELFEFSYAVSIHASAEEFLGTQGDEWDAQKDMLFALIGAITAVFTLSLVHNKFLQKLGIKTD